MARTDQPLESREMIDVASLTDNSGGTSSDTIAAIGGTYNQAEVRNAVASLANKINEMLERLRSLD